MYDDSWYNILPDPQPRRDDAAAPSTKRRRGESLLKQPNEGPQLVSSQIESLDELLEESSLLKGPPNATVIPRANSYSDFHHVARAELTKEAKDAKVKSNQELSIMNFDWNAQRVDDWYESDYDDDLLDASQEEFILYRDQLRLTERHLDTLIEDTTSALNLLAGLSESFDTVEKETTAFQSQCQVLLDDQKRLKSLKEEVGEDLQYYSYLEPLTRRLNAPGASRLVRDESFIEMLTNLNNCIWFMSQHPDHRESETYLTRYNSLLLRALNLFESQFLKDLNDRLEDVRKRRAEGSLNDTTLHALLYRPLSPEMASNLRFISAWAAGSQPDDSAHLETESPATESARRQIQNLIEGIVNSRRDILTPKVEASIQGLQTAIENKDDVMKASRTCIKNILDLCTEELVYIYIYFFADLWTIRQHLDPVDNYTTYLTQFCRRTTEALQQVIARGDLVEAVELTGWIERCYVEDFMQYQSRRCDEATQVFEGKRKEIIFNMSRDVKELILYRFSGLTLRRIEKYEPTEDDLEIAPPFNHRKDSLLGSKIPVSATRNVSNADREGLGSRAIELVGEGYLTAYPPVKHAICLLILHNDMFPSSPEDEVPPSSTAIDVVEKSRFEIIHQTVTAIRSATNRILQSGALANPPTKKSGNTQVTSPTLKSRMGNPRTGFHHYLFAVHNLYLLKQLILVYELHGVTKTSEFDFTDVLATLKDMRDRGKLLDVRAYYNLIRERKLLPKVLERISDARVELDGILRQSIVKFTEGWAGRIVEDWKKEGKTSGSSDDPSFDEVKWMLEWTLVGEDLLIGALISAILELSNTAAEEQWRLPLRISAEKTRR